MPLYRLTDEIAFPPPDRALPDGLLALGGDLSRERLLLAYSMGIFPWYNEGEPLLWWSPDPRMVLLPGEFHVPKRLERLNRQAPFQVTLDERFEEIILACSKVPRPGQDGTWITRKMLQAYIDLHDAGYAHSVECVRGGELVGGLYGVSLGGCFFGESMFSIVPDASKIAFSSLVNQLKKWGFTLIDCQVHTEHLERFGAREIPRSEFLRLLGEGLEGKTREGKWGFDEASA